MPFLKKKRYWRQWNYLTSRKPVLLSKPELSDFSQVATNSAKLQLKQLVCSMAWTGSDETWRFTKTRGSLVPFVGNNPTKPNGWFFLDIHSHVQFSFHHFIISFYCLCRLIICISIKTHYWVKCFEKYDISILTFLEESPQVLSVAAWSPWPASMTREGLKNCWARKMCGKSRWHLLT